MFDQLSDSAVPPGVRASAQLERAFARMASQEGTVDEVLAAAESAATIFAESGDERGLAQAWNSVATQLFWRGFMAQMETAANRAFGHARTAGDERQESWALNALCIAYAFGPTEADTAALRCRSLLARAQELGADALPLFALAGVEGMRGDLAEAWRLYEQGVARGVGGLRTSVSLYAAPLFEADPARAEEELRSTLRKLDDLGLRAFRASAVFMLAEALLELGDGDAAELLAAGELKRKRGEEDAVTRILRLRVTARLRGGDEGLRIAHKAVVAAREAESPHLLAGALAVLAGLEHGPARDEALAEALALQEAKGNAAALAALRSRLDLSAPTR
jgi:hypothetical protein